MTLYLFLIPVLILQIRIWVYLRKVTKDDEVLSKFCDFRRELVTFLMSDDIYELRTQDYALFRNTLHMTNITIRNFERLKPDFNFRTAIRSMRNVEFQVNEQETHLLEKADARIHNFMQEMVVCWCHAFFSYTPWLRHQIALTLAKRGAKLLATVGAKHIATKVQSVYNAADKFNKILDGQEETEAYCSVAT